MKKTVIISLIILAIAAIITVFELHPAVKEARSYISPENYISNTCDCKCILNGRPWYGRFNYWFWLFLFSPAFLFAVPPNLKIITRIMATLFFIGLGYGLILLAADLGNDIHDLPFMSHHSPTHEYVGFKMECLGGMGNIFFLLFGWIPSIMVTGWWLIAWKHYYLKRSKTIDQNFKYDVMSMITVFLSEILTILLICYTLLLVVILIAQYFVS